MARIRRLLGAVLTLGLVGTTADLLLLAHYEDAAQLIPLGLAAVALVNVAWYVARPSQPSLRALQLVMASFLVAGAAGIWLHLSGAAAFQLEIDPSQPWWEVVKKAARAKAPPALAPGTMIMLGLVGLTYIALSRTKS